MYQKTPWIFLSWRDQFYLTDNIILFFKASLEIRVNEK